MKKREFVFVILFILSFMFTITWVYTFQRSRAEYRKGEMERKSIPNYEKAYLDFKAQFDERELNREENWDLLEKQREYFQTVTRALTAYDTSIHSYTPFNKYVKLSQIGLKELGAYCAERGEYQLAFNIYEIMKIGPTPEFVEHGRVKSNEVYELLMEQRHQFVESEKAKEGESIKEDSN